MILAIFCLPACADRKKTAKDIDLDAVEIVREGDTIVLRGFIDSRMLGSYRSTSDANVRNVQITSWGGHPKHAIELARNIRESNQSLIVRDLCLSACAHFLLLASEEVTVMPGALIAFHHTMSSNATLERIVFGKVYHSLADVGQKAEVDFYEEFGADPDFLLMPSFALPLYRVVFDADTESQYISRFFSLGTIFWFLRMRRLSIFWGFACLKKIRSQTSMICRKGIQM